MATSRRGYPDDVAERDRYWLAGLLEGEGSFLKGPPSAPRYPVLALQMTDEDVVARVAAMFDRKMGCWQPRDERWLPTYLVRITGAKAVAWMCVLRPLMGQRRQAQIDRAVASYEPKPSALLTDLAASRALKLLGEGRSVREVAEHFGTSVWCIYDLRGGRTHKDLSRTLIDCSRP
jgi:hypothetical protein